MNSHIPEELVRLWSRFVDDPVGFAKQFWPHVELAPYQREIIESVRDNPETWVHSANEMGKSLIAALSAIWWFSTRRAKVVTSSTTKDQLERVLWGEIDHLLSTARAHGRRFDFRFRRTALRVELGADAEKKYYLIGQQAEQVESFQGHHLQREPDGTPSVLFIFDEASALERKFYDAATSQAHAILVVGNPLVADGVFYEKCLAGNQDRGDGSGRLARKVIHVSGDHSPNVIEGKKRIERGETGDAPIVVPGILSYDQYRERLGKWTPEMSRARLFGLFPDETDARLFPREWLDMAQQLGAIAERAYADEDAWRKARRPHCDAPNGDAFHAGRRVVSAGPYALGVDAAQGGRDVSAWCVFGRFGVRHVFTKSTPNTSEISGLTLRLMRRFDIRNSAVVFDSGGGGKQIADSLRDCGYQEISDVQFSSTPEEPGEYVNRRAELYGELRKALEPTPAVTRLLARDVREWHKLDARCLALPPGDGELRQDLAVLPLSRDSEGRLRLPRKDARRKASERREPCVRELLGGRSPDRGDALVLAYFAWRKLRKQIKLETVDRPLVW
jgi:hypothetical protein